MRQPATTCALAGMDPVAFARFLGLDAILHGQQGVIRRDQAIAAGLSRPRIDGLLRRRRWTAVLPRVYVVGGRTADPRVRVRACWLWAGDRAVIAGAAAAWWLGLSPHPPSVITVIVPPSARRDPQPGFRVIRGVVDERDADFEDWIRVTTASRTCLDLARHGDPDRLEAALRLHRTDAVRLQRTLERGRGLRGQAAARSAVAEVASNPWSPAERLAHRHLNDAGIAGWTANPPVRLRCGTRYPDIAFADIKLAIEIDGRQHHGGLDDFENDRTRHNDFVAAGWTVLHFTWRQLSEHPDRFVATVRATIDRLRAERQPATGRHMSAE